MTLQADIVPDRRGTAVDELRIAHVIGHLAVGGAERHFVSLLNNIHASRRWAVFTSAKRDSRGLYDQLDSGIVRKRIPIRKRSAVSGVLALARFFRKEGIHVVHTHMFWSNLYGSVAAAIAGVPVMVTTEHGENKWKKRHHRWLERHVISRYSRKRFCVSEDILQRRRRLDGVPGEMLEVTSNGTEIPEDPVRIAATSVPLIGTVGRLVPQKNFHLFVDGIADLRRQGRDIQGCIVGDGPMLDAISNHIVNTGRPDAIELPGMSDDVDSWFRRFNIYVVSSSEEGQPVSLLEAMSYGLPVVATDVGAIRNTLDHGTEGLIVPSGNRAALVEAICRYIDDPSLAAACGAAARARVIRDYSIESIARRFEGVYADLLLQSKANVVPKGPIQA